MRGGKRKNAGRPAKPDKKIQYSTRLRPDQIKWLKERSELKQAKHIENAIDYYINSPVFLGKAVIDIIIKPDIDT